MILVLATCLAGVFASSAHAQVAGIEIASIIPAQPTVTAGQTTSYVIRMRVTNTSILLPATLDLNINATYLEFDPDAGWQYTIRSNLEEGSNSIPAGQTRTVMFDVSRTGTTPGVTMIGGTASAGLGGSDTTTPDEQGEITVQSLPSLQYVGNSLQPKSAQRGETVGFTIRLRNPAGAATAVLVPAQTTISFASYSATLSDDVSIPGGATVTLAFNAKVVDPTITLGDHPVAVSARYTHNLNPPVTVTFDPLSDDFKVEAPGGGASLQIVAIIPQLPTATVGQTSPYRIRMVVTNDGNRDVDVTLNTANTNLNFDNTPGWQYTVAPLLASGNNLLQPEETDTVMFDVARTGLTAGVIRIDGTVSGLHSGNRVVTDTIDNGGVITVQNPPSLQYVVGSLQPQVVNHGQQVSFVIRVSNPAGAATAVLNPSLTNIQFSTYTALLNDAGQLSIPGGTARSILFDARVVDASILLGSYPVAVDLDYTHNGNDGFVRFNSLGDDEVTVETGGGGTSPFRIQSTLSNALNRPGGVSYVNTGQSFDIAVQVKNDGPALRDVVVSLNANPPAIIFAPADPIQDIGAGGSASWVFNVRAAATSVQIQTFTASIDTASLVGGGGVRAETPVDDTEFAIVQTPTRLDLSFEITSPPSARDGTISTGQLFNVAARVRNLGEAGIDPASEAEVTIALPGGFRLDPGSPTQTATKSFTLDAPVTWSVRAPAEPASDLELTTNISAIPNDNNTKTQALVEKLVASVTVDVVSAELGVQDVSAAFGIFGRAVPGGTKNIDLYALDLAHLAGEGEENDAHIDTIYVTILKENGQQVSNPASTLGRLYARLDGGIATAPSLAQNPVMIPISGLAQALIGPNQSVTLMLGVDVLAKAASSSIRLSVARGRDLIVRNVSSQQVLGVVDLITGSPIDGRFRSPPLTILSDQFEQYAHNYPNPFAAGSRTTRIAYFLDDDADVAIAIYAMTGDLVYSQSLAAGSNGASSGAQEVEWDGRNMNGEVVRNGVYVCVLQAGSQKAKFRIAVAK